MKAFIKDIELYISSFFISITVIIVIVNVLLRYLFAIGVPWAVEMATICFIWSIFVGASSCYKKKMHIGIDLVTRTMPPKVEKAIGVLVNIIMLILTGSLFYLSIVLTYNAVGKPTNVMGISSAYVNSSLIVGFGMMTVHTMGFLIEDYKMYFKKNFTNELDSK
ncbi:MAG: TRAP transporter small permease [Alkaliphilus sp.]